MSPDIGAIDQGGCRSPRFTIAPQAEVKFQDLDGLVAVRAPIAKHVSIAPYWSSALQKVGVLRGYIGRMVLKRVTLADQSAVPAGPPRKGIG